MDAVSSPVMTPPAKPGKAAMSVGHQAKAAVSAAREAGADLPKNAQGFAASRIAQGADPASLFAAMLPVPDPAPDAPAAAEDGTVPDAVPSQGDTAETETPAAPAADATQAAETGYASATAALAEALQPGAETALALLDRVDITA